MQNTSQTYRGSAAPGVNYSEHSYDNHLGGNHCQSPGYQHHQSYPNQVYQPRPHHYGNHQMQQNVPYRHHGGGAYVPNQNQYGPPMNQDMYRNHHPGYSGPNRNIPVKTWTENNSGDLMQPYGQGSPHSQMMSNPPPPQMPVTAMRSPSHAASNMQPSPQGQQHYGSMQSPVHSPHSWSQAQIPSPGMIHSSRTSPLPAHVRSPGHSQPFSPPSAHSMNIQPHHPPQENGQMQQQSMGSSTSSDNPSNPLHSLQKMVLLDQDPKAMLGLPNDDGNEQFSNQCVPHGYGAIEECSNEPKDSPYATYYNMDENRFESKPNAAANDASMFVPMQQVANCNYPVQPHSAGAVPDTMNSNMVDNYHQNHNQNPIHPQVNSMMEQSQCKSNIPPNDCTVKQNECPPHAESAPVFTDQTQASVSTNSEQALQSKSSTSVVSNTSDPEMASVAQMSQSDTAGTPCPSASETLSSVPESPDLSHQSVNKESDHLIVNNSLSVISDCNSSKSNESENKVLNNPSINTPSSVSQDCDSNLTSTDSKLSTNEESQSSDKKASCNESSKEAELPTLENKIDSKKDNPKNSLLNQSELEFNCARNPVKVVIHRIRKNDSDDTWHVPGSSEEPITIDDGDEKNKSFPLKTSSSPQIIKLSKAIANPSQNPNSSNSASSVDNQNNEVQLLKTVKKEIGSSPDKNSSGNDKKKMGRPFGSKNKNKTTRDGKNKNGKRGQKGKRGKIDNSKNKAPDPALKTKKAGKIFSGPYVHVVGTKTKPKSISVVNVAQKEEEKISKPPIKRVSSAMSRIKSKTVGHLSTLSPTYDAYNRDKTWMCVFCQKGSHFGGLGDLYGPYYIKDNADSKPTPSTSTGTSTTRNKRKKSEADDSKSPKRSKQSSTQSTPVSRQKQDSGKKQEGAAEDSTKEVWLHEDCAIWCQSITMLGEEVRGLDEAVAEANENKCNHCAFHGATLGCLGKGCKEMYHYTCAKSIGCQLDIEKFSLLCRKHKKNFADSRKKCQ